MFGPDQPLATMPFEGERWCISTFASKGYAKLDKDQKKALKSPVTWDTKSRVMTATRRST